MAEYDYEEGAFMALYFLLTFLVIVLVPLTWSLIPTMSKYNSDSNFKCTDVVIFSPFLSQSLKKLKAASVRSV